MKKITDIAKTTKVQWESLAGPIDDNFDELNDGKLSKAELAQTTGNSKTTAMSQAAVTRELTELANISYNGKNLFDRSKVVNGYIDSGSGNLATTGYPNAKCSSLIEVEEGQTYTISGRQDTSGLAGVKADGGRVKIGRNWATQGMNGSFTVPTGVRYVQFTCTLNMEFTEDIKIQLEVGEKATDFVEYVEPTKIPIGTQIKENIEHINQASKHIENIQGLTLNLYDSFPTFLTPNYTSAKTPVTGGFNKWYGFSTEADLASPGILKAIVFSGTSASESTWKARISKKVRDDDDVITGLETVSEEFTFVLPSGENRIDLLLRNIKFDVDSVLELFYGNVPAGLVKYTSGVATGAEWVRYNDQVKTSGSMWDVNVEIAVIKQEEEPSEIKTTKSIKILIVGNSFAEDAFGYVPFIIDYCFPSIDLTLGVLYYGGASLQDHEEHWDNPNDESYYYRKIEPHVAKWTSISNISIQTALKDVDWDIIVFQQKGSDAGNYSTFQPYLNNLIDKMQSVVTKPVRFGWHMVEAYDADLEASNTRFESYVTATKEVLDKTLIDIVFPSATGLQNARTTSLQALGSAGNLMDTSSHAQEGLPCYCLALPNALVIADLCGMGYAGIYGDNNVPTQEWINARAIPNPNGTSVGATEENCHIAQKAAIMAYKKPLQITNLQDLGLVE